MKKLMIGCGVLVLIVGGTLGYLGYVLGPTAVAFYEALKGSTIALIELNETYAYDAEEATDFEPERFRSALELRLALRDEVLVIVAATEAANSGELSMKEGFTSIVDSITSAYSTIIAELRAGEMSPTEFSHHLLTYWAAASSAAAGGGDTVALAPLVEEYQLLREIYDETREHDDSLAPLEERLSVVHEALVVGARDLLAERGSFEPVQREDLAGEILMLHLSDPSRQLALIEAVDAETSRRDQ